MDDLEFITSYTSTKTDVYPHIGLAYIASVAEKNGHEVRITDNRFHSIEEIGRMITGFNPDVVGISATCYTIKNTIKIANLAKKINKDIVIAIGGPLVDIYPKEVLGHDSVDVICFGESDYSFSELLKSIKNTTNLKNVRGIGFKKNRKIIFTAPSPIIMDVDKIPFPARHLLENNKYYCVLSKQLPVTTFISSRGCPFSCTYCLKYPAFRQVFRPRSPKNVVDEMEECVNYGFKEIFFFDDTFSANIKRAKSICNEIINRKLEVFWDIRTRVDCMDKELLVLLKKSNCIRIHYGVEAGDPYILKTLEKGINLEQVEKTFRMTKEIGIKSLAYFMLGVPRDTIETIKRTINFAIKLNPDYVAFGAFLNLPHTKTYYYALEKGILKKDIWKDYTSGKIDKVGLNEIYLLENVDSDTLRKLSIEAYRKFYFRPKKIFKIIKKINSIDELFRVANVALSILKGD